LGNQQHYADDDQDDTKGKYNDFNSHIVSFCGADADWFANDRLGRLFCQEITGSFNGNPEGIVLKWFNGQADLT